MDALKRVTIFGIVWVVGFTITYVYAVVYYGWFPLLAPPWAFLYGMGRGLFKGDWAFTDLLELQRLLSGQESEISPVPEGVPSEFESAFTLAMHASVITWIVGVTYVVLRITHLIG